MIIIRVACPECFSTDTEAIDAKDNICCECGHKWPSRHVEEDCDEPTIAQLTDMGSLDMFGFDPLTVTPLVRITPRLEANAANIPARPSADELAEIADEERKQEMGARLL